MNILAILILLIAPWGLAISALVFAMFDKIKIAISSVVSLAVLALSFQLISRDETDPKANDIQDWYSDFLIDIFATSLGLLALGLLLNWLGRKIKRRAI